GRSDIISGDVTSPWQMCQHMLETLQLYATNEGLRYMTVDVIGSTIPVQLQAVLAFAAATVAWLPFTPNTLVVKWGSITPQPNALLYSVMASNESLVISVGRCEDQVFDKVQFLFVVNGCQVSTLTNAETLCISPVFFGMVVLVTVIPKPGPAIRALLAIVTAKVIRLRIGSDPQSTGQTEDRN
ncbi:hypothetical protein AB0Y31_10955, partial [Lactobacillus crispatus]